MTMHTLFGIPMILYMLKLSADQVPPIIDFAMPLAFLTDKSIYTPMTIKNERSPILVIKE